ncbi:MULTISPECIES: hypothetical protein [Bradyrhizobium]|jgi:hypothetical protein|uniref:hypothetical protein n=1 Tax=Bradyrhizobium TaxID=374 RepID=UPI0004091A86|nr:MULTISPECIES: hypothetical protein [Bradyrhizobium]MBK5652653.1 hypothetical protein [Rhizobium sp.]OCX31974.1 hypothetical protein QU42_06995 [Bradyrhizobium sp. UASWS1016]
MQTELNKVIAAVEEFYAQETLLLERDLGERTLTHRLAVYVERQFAGWQVDCNYDRLGERTLRLPRGSGSSTDDHLGKSIYPDIVVHQRDIPNNLLAIELRKDSNHQPLEHDQRKLQALTDPNVWFAYAIGVLVIVGRSGVSASEVYAGGAIDSAASRWLAQRLRESGLAGERDNGVQHDADR